MTDDHSPSSPLVRMRGVTKRFSGVAVIEGVDLEVRAGEVHVLLGENGAGKSTLMKVLAGVHPADEGEVEVDGTPLSARSVLEAQRAGVVMVMQEFNLIPDLSVAENVTLLNRPEGFLGGWVNRSKLEARAAKVLARLKVEVRPGALVRELSVARQQMVEIAKAMSLSARVLVLDEPTAALTDQEVRRLFELIRELTARGLGVIYISHRFEEIFEIGDRVTVLRDGRRVSGYGLGEVTADRLIRDMAGRELRELYPRSRVEPGEDALTVRGLSTAGRVRDVSFNLRRGEILGLFGLMGAGRTELALALFGSEDLTGGEVRLFGQPYDPSSPGRAMKRGLAYLTEDRKDRGLFLDQSMAFNVSITNLGDLGTLGLVSGTRERARTEEYIRRLRISPPDPARRTGNLSGGTQQKVMLAKWLAIAPKVLILDEPTRGIDVSAKVEIYNLMDRFTAGGGAILLISSDLPELLAMSDRMVVMHEGEKAGELTREDFSQERALALATGLDKASAAQYA